MEIKPTVFPLQESRQKSRINSQQVAVSKKFDTWFLQETLKLMSQNQPVNPLFGGGFAEKMFIPMLYDQIAQKISEKGFIAPIISQELALQTRNNLNPYEEGEINEDSPVDF